MSQAEISGVALVKYLNNENGYSIFEVRTKKGIVLVKGTVDMIRNGDTVTCKGFMTTDKKPNPKFGNPLYLKMTEFINNPPTDRSNIISHLMSSGIKGLGKMTCLNIVDTFGDKTFFILDNEPERIHDVPKIKKAVAEEIILSWKENRSSHIIRNQLISLGFTAHHTKQIIDVYKKDVPISAIKSNPYMLLSQPSISINFEALDYIALRIGIPKTDNFRIIAGSEYTVRLYMKKTGNTIMEYDIFYKDSKKLLGLSSSEFDTFINSTFEKHFHVETDKRLVVEIDSVETYVKYVQNISVYNAEISIAMDVASIKAYPFKPIDNWEKILYESQKEKGHFISGFTLTDEQHNAISVAINNNICIINGGPGVGKTTTLDLLLDIFKKSGKRMLLCAPTGKAAKRMQESTNLPAQTIHRSLEYGPFGFTKNSSDPLDYDIIVVDEFSMVSLGLASSLLSAISPSTKLIIVGDTNQLASIGAGCVLKDFITSNVIPVAKITKIQRQAAASKIIMNSHRVNNGLMPTDKIENNDIEMINDFFFIRTTSDEKTLEMINSIIGTKKSEGRVYDAYRKLKGDETTFNAKDNCQVLTPIHSTLVGTSNLNSILQNNLNPDTGSIQSIEVGEKVFRYNDNVMQMKNDHDQKIYNGDAGCVSVIINSTMDKDKFANVLYKDERGLTFPIKYNPSKLREELMLSYAITIHKSQGSEYPVVIIPIPHYYMPNMDRSLIYTAITRGKHLVIMIGSEQQLNRAVQNDISRIRKTRLVEKLISESAHSKTKPL